MKKLLLFSFLFTILGCSKENDLAYDLDDVFVASYSCDVHFSDQSYYDPKINGTKKIYHLMFHFFNSIKDLQEAQVFYLHHKLNYTFDDNSQRLIVDFDSLALDKMNSSTFHEHVFLFIHKKKRLEFRFKKNEKIEFSIANPDYFKNNGIEHLFYNIKNKDLQFTSNLVDVVGNGKFAEALLFYIDTIDRNGNYYPVDFDRFILAHLSQEGALEFPNDSLTMHQLGVFNTWIYFPKYSHSFKQTQSFEGDQITTFQSFPSFLLPFRFYKF